MKHDERLGLGLRGNARFADAVERAISSETIIEEWMLLLGSRLGL